MNYYDSLFLLTALLGLAYYFIRQRYSYWERLNVPFLKPTFPFGNIKNINKTIHQSEFFQKLYNELKGRSPFAGIYVFISPVVLALDLDFIKNILIKDFNHFTGRGFFHNEKDDPLTGNLFMVDGQQWRGLRSKLTPAFTSGKMKYMFPMILGVAEELKSTIANSVNKSNDDLEIKEVLARFTTDVIGTTAFGIECNSLKDPDTEFRRYGRYIFEKPRNSFLKIQFMNMFITLGRKLKMKIFADDVREFFMGSLRETIRYRRENDVQRNDFLNMLMQQQKSEDSSNKNSVAEDDENKFTFNEIAAQCFAFFVAGFETSSTTMTFSLFEFSVNPDIQRKARQEVLDVLAKHNGKFTYEAMKDMHYLDWCIRETLRKYPPIPTILRQCTKDYPVPNTNVTIAKGTSVMVPVYGIMRDPDIYANPDVYDPERFSPDEVQKRDSLSFLSFGDGPRSCIGLRFGLMQSKVGLATILKTFEVSPCSKSVNPVVLNPETVVLNPEGGMWFNIKKIQ